MAKKTKNILLVGNPNVGKSTVFNHLCNRQQKTGNYAGVTVDSYTGNYDYEDETITITDLPGAYSIYPSSEDEAVFSRFLVQEPREYQGILYIADAINIRRSLLLLQQIKDLGIPVMMVLNQMDLAQKKGFAFDLAKMEKALGVKIIPANAKENQGMEAVKKAIYDNEFQQETTPSFEIPMEYKGLVFKLKNQLKEENDYKIWTLLSAEKYLGKLESMAQQLNQEMVKCLIPKRMQVQETIRRYQNIDKILPEFFSKKKQEKKLLTEKLDKILVHPFFGYLIFGVLLLLIFNSVFYLAEYPMKWIEDGVVFLGDWAGEYLPEGPLKSLFTQGIIPGIVGVLPFAPQIGILLYVLYLLEDSGYMARIVFLTDRFLRPFGLNGKSIVPLVSSTACAVPAIMGARNIENIKERLLTIMVTPFMTCSARLPVYSIIIGLISPDEYFLGFISYKAVMMLIMYIAGFLMALGASFVLKKIIRANEKSYLVMDLPPYKVPMWGNNFRLTMNKVWGFITGSGKIIFSVTVLLWALAFFGPRQNTDQIISADVEMEDSYLAILGKGIEPVVEPLGYDWKIGVGVITSFAARETFVGTMATLYGLEDVDAESEEGELRIMDKMRKDTKPNGEKVFSFATGLSVLMFYAFAMQCISTIAIVYKETRSMKWTLVQMFGMTGIAYLVSFLVYQIFK